MKSLLSGIYLAAEHLQQMEGDVIARSPEEACGFVAGESNQSRLVLPITNILHDPYMFRFDPDEELKAFLSVEKKGWEIIAIYHSHPQGIDHPSATDIAELTFPGIIYLIWYKNAEGWKCRAYLMQSGSQVTEVPLMIKPGEKL